MTKTILIVEDEALVAMEIQESLEKHGYTVPPIIDSGDQVIQAVNKYEPDCVLMDIHLKSFIDGIDAAKRLSLFGSIPVIFLTAYADSSMKDRAMAVEPADYLIKPVSEATLIAKLKEHLK